MPLLDVVTYRQMNVFTTMPFMKALEALNWTEGDSLINAIELFTGMCNQEVYCPTLTRQGNALLLYWNNDPYELRLWIYKDRTDIVQISIGKRHQPHTIETVSFKKAKTLVERWANFLNSDDDKKKKVKVS